MKKVIIAVLLVALFTAPVFAFNRVSFAPSVSCDFAVANGKVQFKQAGIFATGKYFFDGTFFAEGRIGYVTTFQTNPEINGVQIDAMIGNSYDPYVKGAVGLSTDLHIVDEQLTANWAIAAEAVNLNNHFDESFVNAAANLRYVFVNKTGVAPFSFGIGVAHDFKGKA